MSDTRYFVRPEMGAADAIGPVLGPFPEYVQLTYRELTTLDGKVLGWMNDDESWSFAEGLPANYEAAHNCTNYSTMKWTDVVIWAEPKVT